jgi:hypothetical protein
VGKKNKYLPKVILEKLQREDNLLDLIIDQNKGEYMGTDPIKDAKAIRKEKYYKKVT